MKQYKTDPKNGVHEIIVPFGDMAGAADALFDDCPLCQELKKKLERGEAEEVVIPWEE